MSSSARKLTRLICVDLMPILYGMLKALRITSTANPLLKDIRKAVAKGGFTADGYCVAEGFHLLDEALRGGVSIGYVVVAEDAEARVPSLPEDVKLVSLPRDLFDTVAATETSQGVATLLRLPAWSDADLLQGRPLVVVLDGVQDPGNAGSIVRAAEAFGATGVVFGGGSARPQNPKTLRASAGSLFRVPFLERTTWRPPSLALFAAMPFASGVTLANCVNLRVPCAIVIGSEGGGVREFYRDGESIAIATAGVESLNAAVAASILLYEAHRQRSEGRV